MRKVVQLLILGLFFLLSMGCEDLQRAEPSKIDKLEMDEEYKFKSIKHPKKNDEVHVDDIK